MSPSLLKDFARVTKKKPCPICGKIDWCLVSRDDDARPSRCLCKRVESGRRWGNAGWLHELRPRFHERGAPRFGFALTLARAPQGMFEAIAITAHQFASPNGLTVISRHYKVSVESLGRLTTGYLTQEELSGHGIKCPSGVWSFPMRDHLGQVCGVRLRRQTGKFALRGSKNGLFVPADMRFPVERLLIAEGESDTAALLDLGFCAIGKPGAGNADDITVRFVRNVRPREVVVVADNDEIGRTRARDLAHRLSVDLPVVRVITPPEGIKDARAWKIAGADAVAVEAAINASAPIQMSVVRRERGG